MPLNQVSIEEFSLIFQNTYQPQMRKLQNKTQEVHGVVGKTYNAKISAPYDLHDRGAFHSNIPRTVIQYEEIPIPMKDKTALVANDIFEQALVNSSELQNMARQASWALARAQDQAIMDGLSGSTPANTVTAASNLNVTALIAAQRFLDDESVPENERYIIATSDQKASLLSEEEVTSSDFNTIKALVRGEISTYMGFEFIWISRKYSTGGLPKSGAVRKCFAWHRDAITTPYGLEPSVDTDWLPEARSNIVVPTVRVGSKPTLNTGVVLINCTEA